MEEPEDNSSKKALSGEDTFENIFNTDDFESLIRDTMKDMFRQERRKRKLRQGAETEALVQTCSEFMNSFVIIEMIWKPMHYLITYKDFLCKICYLIVAMVMILDLDF